MEAMEAFALPWSCIGVCSHEIEFIMLKAGPSVRPAEMVA